MGNTEKKIEGPFRVYVGLVSTSYLDQRATEKVIADGLEYCGIQKHLSQMPPSGKLKTVIKGDVPFAGYAFSQRLYTDPEIIRATAKYLLQNTDEDTSEVKVLAESKFPLSTKRILAHASGSSGGSSGGPEVFAQRGYFGLEAAFQDQVKIVYPEKSQTLRYQLSKGDLLSPQERYSNLHNPEKRILNEVETFADYSLADLLIHCPKIRPDFRIGGFSGAIGAQAPLFPPDLFTTHRLVDFLEVFHPHIIVGDAVVIPYGKSPYSARGHELGVILVANNAVAHDLVAATLLGIDPLSIDYIKTAIARGWGPESLAKVDLGGFASELENIRLKLPTKIETHTLDTFPVKRLEILNGTPFENQGLHGLLLDYLEMISDIPSTKKNKKDIYKGWPRFSLVLGKTTHYPRRKTVFALGTNAISSLENIISSVRFSYELPKKLVQMGFPNKVSYVQFKNGTNHFVFELSYPTLSQLLISLYLISFGRLGKNLLRPRFFFDLFFDNFFKKFFRRGGSHFYPIALTSQLPQNAWWSLPSSRKILAVAHQRAKIYSAQL